ncbi:hypothetical protein NDU88_004527 [Pleurodeles waltl]|uniref:Uncharacterized protein n=1 Tax=Pleurodeles waltl TaxID=8319 RepID=A0AAV7L502_PLEWA|nr:hypothetical protein NDU88_004527 [Pleurodeles waltl]
MVTGREWVFQTRHGAPPHPRAEPGPDLCREREGKSECSPSHGELLFPGQPQYISERRHLGCRRQEAQGATGSRYSECLRQSGAPRAAGTQDVSRVVSGRALDSRHSCQTGTSLRQCSRAARTGQQARRVSPRQLPLKMSACVPACCCPTPVQALTCLRHLDPGPPAAREFLTGRRGSRDFLRAPGVTSFSGCPRDTMQKTRAFNQLSSKTLQTSLLPFIKIELASIVHQLSF